MNQDIAAQVYATMMKEQPVLMKVIMDLFKEHKQKLKELDKIIHELTLIDPGQKAPVFNSLLNDVLMWHSRNKDLSRLMLRLVMGVVVEKLEKELVDELKKLEKEFTNVGQ